MTKKTSSLALCLLAFGAAYATGEGDDKAAGMTSASMPQYEVSCETGASSASECTVDDGTYAGWGFYSRYCLSCHGDAAEGTAEAPSLADRLANTVDYDRVNYVLMHGHEGDAGKMPAWGDQRAVVENIDPLYKYLKARAEGALPPGTPKPHFE